MNKMFVKSPSPLNGGTKNLTQTFQKSKISFYLSVPTLAGASILGLKDTINQNLEFNILTVSAIFFSFCFSYLTVKYFLAFTKKFSLKIFVYYRIILAGILFAIIYS